VKIVGVEPEAAPTLTRAMQAGRPVDAEAGGIAADSLAPKRVGEMMFRIAQYHVQNVLLVSDESIVEAQKRLWNVLRVVAEPGGAAAFAALLSGRYQPEPGERVGVLVCGGNTTAVDFKCKACVGRTLLSAAFDFDLALGQTQIQDHTQKPTSTQRRRTSLPERSRRECPSHTGLMFKRHRQETSFWLK